MLRQAQQVLALMCGQFSLSAIYRFGDTRPELLSGLELRRSPLVATLPRLLRLVKVAEVRQAMLGFMVASPRRGVRQDGEQLCLWHVFSREGALSLYQVQISGHPDEPRAAQEWMGQVSGSMEGLGC